MNETQNLKMHEEKDIKNVKIHEINAAGNHVAPCIPNYVRDLEILKNYLRF